MHIFIVIFWAFLQISASNPYSEQVPEGWLTDFEQAQVKAESDAKPILLLFTGSDWCRPCIDFKTKVLSDPQFQRFTDEELVLVYLDFPRYKKNQLTTEQQEHNNSLAEQYNEVGTFPSLVLLDSSGSLLGKVSHPENGCTSVINQINSIIK